MGLPITFLCMTLLISGSAIRLTIGILDQAILSLVSSSLLKSTPFDYLLSCWKRAAHLQRNMRPGVESGDHKSRVLAEAKRMAMCYAEYCITMPDMFEYVLDIRELGV